MERAPKPIKVDGIYSLPFNVAFVIEFVEHGLVERFADPIGLRALCPGSRVVDILNRKIETYSPWP
jgi:hypothetical protein